jgi:hypothetical protein
VTLVDFGAVRAVHRNANDPGSTVVGTYGYMPYEQYMGQASPASDLYGLGATFLHLVTGRPPRDFMTEAGLLELPADLPCGEPLRSVLARLLAPAPSDRFQSAREARAALFAAPTAVALATRAPAKGLAVSAGAAKAIADLPPAPRPADRGLKQWARRIAGSPLQLMDAGTAPSEGVGIGGLTIVAFFSVLTFGTLPLVYSAHSAGRRRRVLPFLRSGAPATGVILGMDDVAIAFGGKLTQVGYEFEVDGRTHRGSDQVLPWITQRWQVGDRVPVLYLEDRDFDSIIISRA